jgi:glutathione S-transferase
MELINFYQIPFSHFCEKVRWALDFYSIPYKRINFGGSRTQTPGLEKAPKELQKLLPIIEDPNNQSLFITDSTPILLYLDNHYGNKNKLFPSNLNIEKDLIYQYCLKLDSELGLYSRRLAYLHIIIEKPSLLSVFIDGNYDKVSYDDWKSYFGGLFVSCFLIARLAIHRMREEHIFEKTVSILEEIKENINDKEYLFNNQFTAADLTLTCLIEPLKIVPSLVKKYNSVFEYTDRIRERHDPTKYQQSNIGIMIKRQRQLPQQQSTILNLIWIIFYILFYPLQFFFNNKTDESLLQYPSANINEKAHNDTRVMKLNSEIKLLCFFIKYFWHRCFTISKQFEYL